jgi:hypothetical protein
MDSHDEEIPGVTDDPVFWLLPSGQAKEFHADKADKEAIRKTQRG